MAFRKYLLAIAVLTAVMIPTLASATTLDSIYGTTISNTAKIYAGNIAGETYASASDTYVAQIAGDTLWKPTETANGNVGDTIVFTYILHNTGNSGDSFSVSVVNDSYGYGSGILASGWNVALFTNADTIISTTTNGETLPLGIVTEDGIATFYVAVGIPSNAANAPNGSYWQVNFNVRSGTTAVTAAYTGDNLVPYAEATSNAGDNNYGCDTITVAGAAFALTKSCTSSLGGVDQVPRPGATLWFSIGYVNEGSGSGDSVAIMDTLDTTVVTYSDTITAEDSPASGWGLQVASGDGIWVDPGAIPASAVKYLLWWKQTVIATETAIHRYRVTIN